MRLHSEDDVFIGVDYGTSGVRFVAIDRQGVERAAVGVQAFPSWRDENGRSEQAPDGWWQCARAGFRLLMPRLAGRSVRSVTVAATSSTLLLCRCDGQPLTPGLMYDDRRAAGRVPGIAAVAPPETAVISASSSLAKLLHLLDGHVASRDFRALHQADWLAGMLSGRFGISDENNCLKLGYDALRRRWPEWLDRLGLPDGVLPEVHPPGTPIAKVTAEAAAATGLPADCMVTTGTTDSVAAAVASGISKCGEAVTSLGSTLVLKVLADRPVFAPDYGIYSHRLGDVWLAGGASNSGGAVLAYFFSVSRITELSGRIEPERSLRLDYYPLLRPGERFPINDPGMQPRLSPRPEDDVLFLQALLEGMAWIEMTGYQRLSDCGAPYPTLVRSIGGGAGNEAWRRIRQTRVGVPVVNAAHGDAAYGAALLGLRGSIR
jgi:hypothetical protein